VKQLGPVGKYMYDVTEHYVQLLTKWNAEVVLHDPTAIMVMLQPELFKSEFVAVDVEADSKLTAGVRFLVFAVACFCPLSF
jgi:inosine-uridine nucleoside N-ribohydrolase